MFWMPVLRGLIGVDYPFEDSGLLSELVFAYLYLNLGQHSVFQTRVVLLTAHVPVHAPALCSSISVLLIR